MRIRTETTHLSFCSKNIFNLNVHVSNHVINILEVELNKINPRDKCYRRRDSNQKRLHVALDSLSW